MRGIREVNKNVLPRYMLPAYTGVGRRGINGGVVIETGQQIPLDKSERICKLLQNHPTVIPNHLFVPMAITARVERMSQGPGEQAGLIFEKLPCLHLP